MQKTPKYEYENPTNGTLDLHIHKPAKLHRVWECTAQPVRDSSL